MFRVLKLSLSVAMLFTATTALAAGGNGGGATCTCLSLSVSKEVAPPGSLVQLKVFITEPKPISTGGGSITFDAYDTLYGISLSSHSPDSYGVAVVNGNNMKLSVISPSATFGSTTDYPLLTVVGRVPPATPIGTKFPMTLDPGSLLLYDPTGALYPTEVKQGHLVAGQSVTIGDITPGSAVVPAGGTVLISGANFVPGTNIKFAEAAVSNIEYIDSGHLLVTLGTTANMHGMMIKASNPDGTKSVYFSYQRTFPMPVLSSDPVMKFAVPLAPLHLVNTATIALPAPVAGTTYGIALQNITADTTATILVTYADGTTAMTTLDVGVNKFVVREFSELFGAPPAAPSTVVVMSPVAIEALGIAADQTAGTASPILPQ